MAKRSAERIPPETSLERYDWSRSRRGRYAARRVKAAKVVLVAPEVYAHFGGPEAINEALRALMQLSHVVAPRPKRRRAA
jgi:hypothetical protein